MTNHRKFGVVALGGVFLLTALAVLLSMDSVDIAVRRLASDSAFVLGATIAAVACARAAHRSSGRLRIAWWLFTANTTAWVIGNVSWFYYQNIADTQPYPSIADIFYVAAIPLAAAGLLTFPVVTETGTAKTRRLLDALVIGVSVLLLSTNSILGEVFAGTTGVSVVSLAVLAQPVGDVVLLSLALLMLTRISRGNRTVPALLAAAFFTYTLTDSVYVYQGMQGTFEIGHPIDVGWVTGYLLVALAALCQTATQHPPVPVVAAEARPIAAVAAYLPLILAFSVHFVVIGHPRDRLIDALSIAVVALLATRQTLLAADNDALRRGLEARVRERTAEIERLARRSELILDSVAEGIYGVDRKGRVTFANPAAGTLLGLPADKLIGEHAHSLFHSRREDGTPYPFEECQVTRVLRDGVAHRGADEVYQRADGTAFPIEFSASPTVDGERVTGAVISFSDITERREVERMKDEFISVVSHELRTPLTSIKGSLGLIAGGAVGELPPAAARMVSIALDSSERLTRLINDILDIERIQSGSVPMRMTASRIEDVLLQARAELGPLATAAGLTLETTGSGTVHADPDRVAQVLSNLVGNAVKFSPVGSRVRVQARPSGADVLFQVTDEGRGIPTDKLEAVFERFQQVDSSDSREKGGTGLGLAICRTIIERHGGRIWVESSVGAGTTFSFTLPAAGSGSDEEARRARDPQDDGAPLVLLCDDDAQVLEVLANMLERRGYRAVTVTDADAFVETAERLQPNVMAVDLLMPHPNGWQLLSRLAASPQTRDIPVIVVSALGPEDDPELADQVRGWVTKPADDETICRAVIRAASSRSTRPRVLVVEDDDDLAGVMVATLERWGVSPLRAETARRVVELGRRIDVDAIVLDVDLPDGDGFSALSELASQGRLCDVPVVVYSAEDTPGPMRALLGDRPVIFLTKGRTDPDQVGRQLLALVEEMTDVTEGGVGNVATASAGR